MNVQTHKEPLLFLPIWTIWKHPDEESYRRAKAEGNLDLYVYEKKVLPFNDILWVGWEELIKLMIGSGGQVFDNTNARLRIGDSAASVVQTQTDLQGANKFDLTMDDTYPQITGANNQNVIWQATADGATGNQDWNEMGLKNGNVLFNRKVSAEGTKQSGRQWTLQLELQGQ